MKMWVISSVSGFWKWVYLTSKIPIGSVNTIDIFLRMNLEYLGNQVVKSASIYWPQGQFSSSGSLDILCISWKLSQNWILLIKSIHIWLKNREDLDSQSLWKYFYPRKSRYFLMIMKIDRTGGDINVTIESLLAPQNFLNMPLGSFCQNQWYLFLLTLSLCFHHMLSFKCLTYMVMLSETMTEERCYISLDLTVQNYRHVSISVWRNFIRRNLPERESDCSKVHSWSYQ